MAIDAMDPESPPPPPESGAGVIELSIVKEFIKTVSWPATN